MANIVNVAYLSFDATDIAPMTVSYGSPFPNWSPLFSIFFGYFMTLTPPGGGKEVYLPVNYIAEYADMSVFAQPFGPVLGQVHSPTINGHDFHVAQNGVGTTPTFAWQPPSLGTATNYNVIIHSLNVDAMTQVTTLGYVASLNTHETSIQVPPGLLTTGTSYVALVRAVSSPVSDLSNEPMKSELPYVSVDNPSQPFTP
jgi:hypothetical protein